MTGTPDAGMLEVRLPADDELISTVEAWLKVCRTNRELVALAAVLGFRECRRNGTDPMPPRKPGRTVLLKNLESRRFARQWSLLKLMLLLDSDCGEGIDLRALDDDADNVRRMLDRLESFVAEGIRYISANPRLWDPQNLDAVWDRHAKPRTGIDQFRKDTVGDD